MSNPLNQSQQLQKRGEKKQKKPKDFTPVYVWGCKILRYVKKQTLLIQKIFQLQIKADAYGQLGLASKEFGKSCPSPKFTSFSVIIEDIACGEEHTSFIAQNGYVYSMGNNNQGQLGIQVDDSYQKSAPTLVEGLKGYKAIQISCGAYHTAAVCDNGQLFTWGQNCEGQLGIGRTDNMKSPQIVDLKNNLAAFVSCGKRNTMVITQSQKVYGFGDGKCGQLGLGNETNEYKPKQVQLPVSNIIAISCGDTHTLLLTEEGEAYSCGNNQYNQLGCVNNCQSTNIPVKVKQKPHQKFIKVIASHSPVSVALSTQGFLYLWGTGFFGQLDRPTRCEYVPQDLVDFSVGNQFICLLDQESKVYTWGSNMSGELGQGIANGQQVLEPIRVDKIKDKNVKRLYSGANFVFAMGENWIHQQTGSDCGYESKDTGKLSTDLTSKRTNLSNNTGDNYKQQPKQRDQQMDLLRRMSDTPFFEENMLQQQQQGQNQTSERLSSQNRQNTSSFINPNQTQQYSNNVIENHDQQRLYSEQSFQEKKKSSQRNRQENHQFNNQYEKDSKKDICDYFKNNNSYDVNVNNRQNDQSNFYQNQMNEQQIDDTSDQDCFEKKRTEYGEELFENYYDQSPQSKYTNTQRLEERKGQITFSPHMNKENINLNNSSLKQQYQQQQLNSSYKNTNNHSHNQLSFDDSQMYEPMDYTNFISDSKQSKPNSVQKQKHIQQNKGVSLITYNKTIPHQNSKDKFKGTTQLNNYLNQQTQNIKETKNIYPVRERSSSTSGQAYSFLSGKGNVNDTSNSNLYEIKYKQLKLKYERSRMERDEYQDKLKYEREVNKNLLIRLERKTKKQRELEKRLEFLNMDLQMNKRTYDMKIEELLKKLASYESKIETKQYKDFNFLKSFDDNNLDKSTNRNLSDINYQINTTTNRIEQNEFDNISEVSESYNIVMKDETPSKLTKNKNQTVSFSPLNQSDFSAIDYHNSTMNSRLNQTGGTILNNITNALNNTQPIHTNNQNVPNFVEEIIDKYNKRQLNKQNPLIDKIIANKIVNTLAKKDLNVTTDIDFIRQSKNLRTCPNTYNNCISTSSQSHTPSLRCNLFSQPFSTKQSSYTRPSSTTAQNSIQIDKGNSSRAQSSLSHQYRYKLTDKTHF